MNLEINNQKDFFKKVELSEDGVIKTVLVPKTGTDTATGNAYNFFKKIALDINGNLKIFK